MSFRLINFWGNHSRSDDNIEDLPTVAAFLPCAGFVHTFHRFDGVYRLSLYPRRVAGLAQGWRRRHYMNKWGRRYDGNCKCHHVTSGSRAGTRRVVLPGLDATIIVYGILDIFAGETDEVTARSLTSARDRPLVDRRRRAI